MPRIEVVMPQMGESIAEGTIVKWHKKIGDQVKKDETLLEISTDKVDSEIPSPAAGTLAEIVIPEQQTVAVRTVIAYLDVNGGPSGASARPAEKKGADPLPAKEPQQPAGAHTGQPKETPKPEPPRQEERPPAGRFYSPLVLNIARTEGVAMSELENIPGSGEGGRVSKKDILAYVAGRQSAVPAAATVEASAVARPPAAAETTAPGKVSPPLHHEVVRMSTVMQKMAEHMVKSVHTSPHVAAIHEVDMTEVVRHRNANAAPFEQREGFKLTYTPYIVEAVVNAIKKYPLINSSVDGDKIIRKQNINLGIAVASDNGLIVPIIRKAEERNFLGLARAVNDLAVRTRGKKLTPDDIQGGTFTISNYGVFGTMIGTPIINQPQVAILGTGAITPRVAVVGDAIAIRSLAYFTLSFDHRIIDGALGGMFMEEIVKGLEQFDPKGKLGA